MPLSSDATLATRIDSVRSSHQVSVRTVLSRCRCGIPFWLLAHVQNTHGSCRTYVSTRTESALVFACCVPLLCNTLTKYLVCEHATSNGRRSMRQESFRCACRLEFYSGLKKMRAVTACTCAVYANGAAPPHVRGARFLSCPIPGSTLWFNCFVLHVAWCRAWDCRMVKALQHATRVDRREATSEQPTLSAASSLACEMPEKRPPGKAFDKDIAALALARQLKKSRAGPAPRPQPPPSLNDVGSSPSPSHPSLLDDVVSVSGLGGVEGGGWHLRACSVCACQRHTGHGAVCSTCRHADVCHTPHQQASAHAPRGLAYAARLLLQCRVALVKLASTVWSKVFLEAAWAAIEDSGGVGTRTSSKKKGKRKKNKSKKKQNPSGGTEHLAELRKSCGLALQRLAQWSLANDGERDLHHGDISTKWQHGDVSNRWLLLRAVAAIDDFYYRVYYDDLTDRAAVATEAGVARSEIPVRRICLTHPHLAARVSMLEHTRTLGMAHLPALSSCIPVRARPPSPVILLSLPLLTQALLAPCNTLRLATRCGTWLRVSVQQPKQSGCCECDKGETSMPTTTMTQTVQHLQTFFRGAQSFGSL